MHLIEAIFFSRSRGCPVDFDGDPVTSGELATLFQTVLGTPRLRAKGLRTNMRHRSLGHPDRSRTATGRSNTAVVPAELHWLRRQWGG